MPTKLTATGITFPNNDVLAGVATTVEATTGTSDTVAMTPLKVAQTIAEATIDYQLFETSRDWTKPDGISADAVVTVEAWGAGGGGGCQTTTSSSGGGGGGGGYTIWRFRLGDLPATVAVGIGSGGTGGGGGVNGTAGGDSTFGALVTAYGGNGGTFSSSNTVPLSSALAGTLFGRAAGTGTEYFNGGSGGNGQGAGVKAYMGGGGGGSANGTTAYAGGTSIGGGAGGTGGRGTAAVAGSVPGGGGGGSAASGAQGRAGGRGEVRVSVVG
jgi:hypothetical protein